MITVEERSHLENLHRHKAHLRMLADTSIIPLTGREWTDEESEEYWSSWRKDGLQRDIDQIREDARRNPDIGRMDRMPSVPVVFSRVDRFLKMLAPRDPFDEWVERRVSLDGDGFTTLHDLWMSYAEFTRYHRGKDLLTERSFGIRMKRDYGDRWERRTIHGKRIVGYNGVSIFQGSAGVQEHQEGVKIA